MFQNSRQFWFFQIFENQKTDNLWFLKDLNQGTANMESGLL
jgi:hypothetical protein